MPAKNNKQLNFFLLVKAYKEGGELGVMHQVKYLSGYKPRLNDVYMQKLAATAATISDADLIDKTSGIEGSDVVGDERELKPGYWALFRGKYKPTYSNDEVPKEGEFIAQIKRVNNQNKIVYFNLYDFRNSYGQKMDAPRRAQVTHPDFMYLDEALFDNVIKTGKTPQEVAKKRENMEESLRKTIRKVLFENQSFGNNN